MDISVGSVIVNLSTCRYIISNICPSNQLYEKIDRRFSSAFKLKLYDRCPNAARLHTIRQPSHRHAENGPHISGSDRSFGSIQLSPDTDEQPHNIGGKYNRMHTNIVRVISTTTRRSLDFRTRILAARAIGPWRFSDNADSWRAAA
jgi:hypothetical protein